MSRSRPVGPARSDFVLVGLVVASFAAAAASRVSSVPPVAAFACSGIAIALFAALVARSVDALVEQMGSGAIGVLHSALGNLPELFVGFFALRAGLIGVLEAALVGSIVANVVLVLGLAFIAGGVRHGTQRFATDVPRLTLMLLVLATAIVSMPTLTAHLTTAVNRHEVALSNVAAVVLLVVFALSIPFSVRHGRHEEPVDSAERRWPVPVAIGALVFSSVGAFFVSDWFIASLGPAIATLHISAAFAGFVVVALASNAIENVVGVRLAYRNRPDYSLSVILQSPVQIAVGLIPALVLLSNVVGPRPLTLVFPTLYLVVLALSVVVAIVVVFDGESTWLEGVALVGLYAMFAAVFWLGG